MPAIKPLDKSAKKWAKVAAASRDEYLDGVQNPRRDWQEETSAAKERYESGLSASFANDSFVKGVQAAGTAKWRDRSIKFGPGRYSEGVRGSEAEYRQGFAPFHSRIQSTNLPPRGPKGSPENIERVRIMAEALHDEKISGS